MFDLPPPDADEPNPSVLGAYVHEWSPVIGRDLRPLGVRIRMRRRDVCAQAAEAAPPAWSTTLDAVLRGFLCEGGASFPHGLVVLAPQDMTLDASMLSWRAPRNVVLELPVTVLANDDVFPLLAEIHRLGVRLALNLPDLSQRLDGRRMALFQYVVVEGQAYLNDARASHLGGAHVLVVGAGSPAECAHALDAGAHGVVGWQWVAPGGTQERTLAPTQQSVLSLIRLAQSDSDVDALEAAFKGEPILAYMLLTLANSPAFVRATPIASIRHAISLLGYRRLVKWLVLLMVVASKETKALPQIYNAVARGFLMENLAIASGAPTQVQDESFVVGAFSLLDTITGISLPALLEQVTLPDTVVDALLHQGGMLGKLLLLALAVECARVPHEHAILSATESLHLDLETVNRALLQALAATDALQSAI